MDVGRTNVSRCENKFEVLSWVEPKQGKIKFMVKRSLKNGGTQTPPFFFRRSSGFQTQAVVMVLITPFGPSITQVCVLRAYPQMDQLSILTHTSYPLHSSQTLMEMGQRKNLSLLPIFILKTEGKTAQKDNTD